MLKGEVKTKAVLSMCDFTGFFVADWVAAGYEAIIVDPQHKKTRKEDGVIKVAGTVIDSVHLIRQFMEEYDIRLVAGFPPCTDVANSGNRWFDSKIKADALVWAKAAIVAEQCRMIGALSGAPWFFENPVSKFADSMMFGPSDLGFHPFEYGGYLPEDDEHPLYPDFINPRDAYTKNTRLWCGNGYELPEKRPVAVPADEEGKSKLWGKLGGDSLRTKNIRSATPRGFARANFLKYSR